MLAAGDLDATFLPSASMLGVSLRKAGDELLAPVAPLTRYRAGHVTGIPFLYPWANRLATRHYRVGDQSVDVAPDAPVDPNGLPIHGTVAGLPFDVVIVDGDAARLRARLDATDTPRIAQSFPFPHTVEVDARVDDRALTITTTVHATGDLAVPVSFGYHPYLRLTGAPRHTWRLRMPERAHVALDERQLPTGAATGAATDEPVDDRPLGHRTYDDHYRLGADRRFELEAAGRRLTVTFDTGYPYAQVYAPPRTQFLCIEPMTATVNALVDGTAPVAEPGHHYEATWSVAVADV